jgi:hypothetical protein
MIYAQNPNSRTFKLMVKSDIQFKIYVKNSIFAFEKEGIILSFLLSTFILFFNTPSVKTGF